MFLLLFSLMVSLVLLSVCALFLANEISVAFDFSLRCNAKVSFLLQAGEII